MNLRDHKLEIPTYSVAEAAHYLLLPKATVRSWILGRPYPTGQGKKFFQPLIDPADPRTPLISFQNLVELHVLGAVRRQHKIRMPAIRQAIQFLRKRFKTAHPLTSREMLTDGKDLFIEEYGRLISVSEQGQLALRQVLDLYLQRIDRNPRGLAVRLFPFSRTNVEKAPRLVVIDPEVQFGKPCIAGRGVPTAIVAERHRAGDSVKLLSEDYRCTTDEIEEALRFEAAA